MKYTDKRILFLVAIVFIFVIFRLNIGFSADRSLFDPFFFLSVVGFGTIGFFLWKFIVSKVDKEDDRARRAPCPTCQLPIVLTASYCRHCQSDVVHRATELPETSTFGKPYPDEGMILCPRCCEEIPAAARRCHFCKLELISEENSTEARKKEEKPAENNVKTTVCPKCGIYLPLLSKTCGHCGWQREPQDPAEDIPPTSDGPQQSWKSPKSSP